jgi:PBSX family phage terminase large subunit
MIVPTEKQKLAISKFTDYKNILLTGGVRSGKTFSICIGVPVLIENHREENCMLGAKTLSNVERNILNPLRTIYGNCVGQITHKRGETNVKIFGKEFWVICFNDESSKNRLQGTSIGLAILDEVALCPKSFYEMLRTRLDKPFSQLIMTCNPEGPNHYIKTDLIDNADIKSKFIQHWTLYDNREHLPEDVIHDFENAFRRSPTFYKRMILGQWCSADGLACFNFDRDRHFKKISELLVKDRNGESFIDKFLAKTHTLIYAIDPANANDMTGGCPVLYNSDDCQLVLRRFAHNPKTSKSLSNVEQVRIIRQHINGLFNCDKIPIKNIRNLEKIMLVDCAGADMFIQCCYEFERDGWQVIKMTKKDIKQTLEIMNNIMASNRCTIVDYEDGGVYDYTLGQFTYEEPLINELQSVRIQDMKTALVTRIGLNPEDPNDSFDAYRYNTAFYFRVEDVSEEIT